MPPFRPSKITRWLKVGPLTARLLTYVLLYSLVLSLVATGLQLLNDHRQEKELLLQTLERATHRVAPSLAVSLWNDDSERTEQQIETLLGLPGIQYARIETAQGRVLEYGATGDDPLLEQAHPLTLQPGTDDSLLIGSLVVGSSLEPLYRQLWGQAMFSLLVYGVVVLLGALGLLMIVRMTLTRHLEVMAKFARSLDFTGVGAPLRLKRRERRTDELNELEKALNTMRTQLLEQTERVRQSEAQSQNERDEAIRANQAKNLFLANISHELRTPLQAVLGYAALLQDSELDPEQRDYVLTLKHSAENLSSIVNDLLDISRMEAGKIDLEILPFDLRATLDDIVTMLGPKAREKQLALERRVDPHLPSALLGDPIRCRQILLNLVANAIKFTDSGHIMISAEVLERTRRGEVKLRLSVEDTGTGIPAGDVPLIYEPYVQLEHRFKRQQLSGAGLGLTISRQLASLMKGKLEVESSPGEGSTFWLEITLPVAREKSAQIREDTRAILGTRILVADSYELSRKLSLDLLDSLGAEVEGVRTAAEVLLRLAEAIEVNLPFDALLVDGFLPDMDCDLLCQQVRQSTDFSNTRIMVLSANPQRGDAEHFRHAGADAFLSKALRESLLAPLMQQMFSERRLGSRSFLTRFSLTKPRQRAATTDPVCSPIHVLLVEDNPVNRALTERLLTNLGATVVAVNDGEAALVQTARERFDLIFMDCNLPGIDGFETTRQLQGREKELAMPSTPVVALTASAMEKDEEMCRRAGMLGFIAKPVTQDMLRAMLVRYCPEARQAATTTIELGAQ